MNGVVLVASIAFNDSENINECFFCIFAISMIIANEHLVRYGGCFVREQANPWRPRGAEEADVPA